MEKFSVKFILLTWIGDWSDAEDDMLHFIRGSIYSFFHLNKLRYYENVCLDSWRYYLPSEINQKLDRQLQRFDLIQRQSLRLKSVFYCVKDPQYRNWNDDILFPDRSEKKVMIGTLSAQIEDVVIYLKFCIYIFKGRLSSIEFSSEPGILARLSKGLTVSDTNIIECFSTYPCS
ncbi:hypothetical protein LJC47_07300 [Desulfosarcina sp. OttesenSCG-928-B08]|nr:hypothetical protein [Desulfosarcina sp. OttesenSCG-928-B08]